LGGGDTNLYAYVGGDPINATDPTGLFIEGNSAMDSALNGGLLSWLGFEQFARGAFNYREGTLKLSNDATFNEGIAQMRQGICQMVGGGITVATTTGPMAMSVAGLLGAVVKSLPRAAAQIHHIATNKHSRYKGAFTRIFNKGGMSLSNTANKILVPGHNGRHTNNYHEYVLGRLETAVSGLSGPAYRDALIDVLAQLATEIRNNPRIMYQ
jgi:hypothetical protein